MRGMRVEWMLIGSSRRRARDEGRDLIRRAKVAAHQKIGESRDQSALRDAVGLAVEALQETLTLINHDEKESRARKKLKTASITKKSVLSVRVLQAIKKTNETVNRRRNDLGRQNQEADPHHQGRLQANLRPLVLSDPTLIDLKLQLSN